MAFEFVKRELMERNVVSPSTIGIASSEMSEVKTDNFSLEKSMPTESDGSSESKEKRTTESIIEVDTDMTYIED